MRIAVFFLLICAIAVLPNSSLGKRGKTVSDSNFFFSGITTLEATKWEDGGQGVISSVVDLAHMKFDRTPKYFVSIVGESQKGFSKAKEEETSRSLVQDSILQKVVGKHEVVDPSANGFRLLLRYNSSGEEDDKLTSVNARLDRWRIRWVAVSAGHSLIEKARQDVVSDKYENSVDEKPVGQALAYVKILESLVKEDSLVVKGAIGQSYENPKSKRPKVKKVKKQSNDTNKANSKPDKDQESTREDSKNVEEEANSEKKETETEVDESVENVEADSSETSESE